MSSSVCDFNAATFPEPRVFSDNVIADAWSEDKTPLRHFLFLQAGSFKYQPIFDIPPSPAGENFVVSPKRNFAYENRILPAGWPIPHQGRQGWVVFDGDVSIPMLIDMKIDHSTGDRFPAGTKDKERVISGVIWMSLTPSEMITQRPGVQKAKGTVVIGGLGLGWLLRKTCEKTAG